MRHKNERLKRSEDPCLFYPIERPLDNIPDTTLEKLIIVMNDSEDPQLALLIIKIFAAKINASVDFNPILLNNFVRYAFTEIANAKQPINANVLLGIQRAKGRHARPETHDRDLKILAKYTQECWKGNTREKAKQVAAEAFCCDVSTVSRAIARFNSTPIFTPENIGWFLPTDEP